MKEYEARTIRYYNDNAEAYFESTSSIDMQELYSWFLSYINAESRILDLGCGSGRDAKYFSSKGYEVIGVDGSKELCKHAANFSGCEIYCKLFSEIDYYREFDAVWACASLLHIAKNDINNIIKLVTKSLKPGGIFFSCYKYGEKEEIRGERYYNDYTEAEIYKQFYDNELDVIDVKITDDKNNNNNTKWINVIVRMTEK